MSHQLWKYYFDDDADSFGQLLGEAGVARRSTAQRTYISEQHGLSIGPGGGIPNSPGPRNSLRSEPKPHTTPDQAHADFSALTLTRADINRRDGKGLTLLHHAASSTNENAKTFALALIAHPLVDVHIQDLENGWTALHRAFYFSNISVARAILEKESHDAIGAAGLSVQAASLVKTKDFEGNGPYDILTATIRDRTLHHLDAYRHVGQFQLDIDEDEAADNERFADSDDETDRKNLLHPLINLGGDELLTFGSNKNITLGLGNQDDRQFPERVSLKRPDHLFRRFHREHIERQITRVHELGSQYSAKLRSSIRQRGELYDLPAMIRSKPLTILDVQMSKFHTAVLTNDPVSNLYLCGHGPGGRLGVADEKTRFSLVCVEDFGSSRKRIIAVALGQDHTLAVTDRGELFTWGSNEFGQLGLGLSKTSVNAEEPHHLVPKQLFGPIKRELIVGVAASRIHSVAHTSTALYTFGKNEGQLGIVDAHARSLKIQATPRRVAASRFSCAIQSTCATEKATICLLENHEVHVLANYGIVKLQFPLDQFANPLSEKSQTATRYDDSALRITKVTCGGDTICALSNAGEIFAVTVDQRLDPASSGNTSTTNPNKIRDALSQPLRIWSLKKGHMSARDVAVDQDGSIIITTEAGNVWRRMRRATLNKTRISAANENRSKEFKISRVPGLTRVIAVRASAAGAYCAIRSECDVTKTQIVVDDQKLWADTAALLPFRNMVDFEPESEENDSERDGSTGPHRAPRRHALQALIERLIATEDLEKELGRVLRERPNENCSHFDAVVRTSVSDLELPAHAFIFASRSRYLRDAFASCRRNGTWSDDLFSLDLTTGSNVSMTFKGIDILTVVDFVLYAYTDQFVAFWLRSKSAPQLAFRYRQVRSELQKIAIRFDLQPLESAVRRMARAALPCLDKDFDIAVSDLRFFEDGDASVQLQDAEVSIHSDLMSRRCPFFEGLFQGRAGGRWLDDRRGLLASPNEVVSVDLTHVELHVFQLVLRHMYADAGEELFDDIVTKDLDEFLDLILDVLSVANELMLDRLSRVCQEVLGRYVSTRNVCQLLNAVAPSSVTEFKTSALEFICLNLEGMLSNHLLDELDEELLHELDDVVRDNQLNSLPFAKSGRAETLLQEKYPNLVEIIAKDKRAQLDWMRIRAKHAEQDSRSFGASLDPDTDDLLPTSPRSKPNTRAHSFAQLTPKATPSGSLMSPTTMDSKLQGNSYRTPSASNSPFTSPNIPPSVENKPALPRELHLGSPQLEASPDISTSSNVAQEARSSAAPRSATALPAWGSRPLQSTKLGMKEIMDQASSSRTSNLSLGFAKQDRRDERTLGSFNVKLSQKERRRQLQQSYPGDSPLAEPQPATDPSSSPIPASPWQTAAVKSKPTVQQSPSQVTGKPSPARPSAVRSTTTPQLTMRQTIANPPPSGTKEEAHVHNAPQTPTSQRTVSTPQASSTKPTPPSQPSSSSTNPIEIQSIRHAPRANTEISPTFHMHQSLADILSQQEAEKNVVKEAVAKRSLQEIQQEQEFQAWWDQESKRVMEAEAAAARAASSRGRGGSSRGGRSRGRRGRGGKDKAPETTSSQSTS